MRYVVTAAIIAATIGCATSGGSPAPDRAPLAPYQPPADPEDPPPATAKGKLLIRGATIMTAANQTFAPGYLLVGDGLIEAVGAGDGPAVGSEVRVIDASGTYVTPGIIDTHSHMGVYPMPHASAHGDGNEMSSPTRADVWAEHAFWPQDPALRRALRGGVTTIQVLPGSGNLIGGRSFVAKLRRATSARAMRFSGAPQGLKMACGENPKRIHGKKGGPMSRMGNVAGHRKAFQEAFEYKRKWERYRADLAVWEEKEGQTEDPPDPPARDLGKETLAKMLAGEILVHVHCYRADEMHIMLDLAKSFGFKIRSFHHGLEAYKLRHRLAKEEVATSTWADWWGFKMEAFDGIPQNAAMLAAASARAIIHSDSATEIRYLNQEAAKARASGRMVGVEVSEDEALRWITANPAWALGVDHQVGTLEAGKMADLVIWDRHPFSVYAKTRQVIIDGHVVFDRSDPESAPPSDFELGNPPASIREEVGR